MSKNHRRTSIYARWGGRLTKADVMDALDEIVVIIVDHEGPASLCVEEVRALLMREGLLRIRE